MDIVSLLSHTEDFKKNIYGFRACRTAKKVSLEKKPASMLDDSLGKALNRILSSLCGQEIAGLVAVARSD